MRRMRSLQPTLLTILATILSAPAPGEVGDLEATGPVVRAAEPPYRAELIPEASLTPLDAARDLIGPEALVRLEGQVDLWRGLRRERACTGNTPDRAG